MCFEQARSPDNTRMKQSSLGLSNTVKHTRKREFLDAMELVVPWAELVALIEPYAPESGRRGQHPDGQVKFPHPWPPQIPPGRTAGL